MKKRMSLLLVAIVVLMLSIAPAYAVSTATDSDMLRSGMTKQLRKLYKKANPELSKNKLALKVGETKELKVLPKEANSKIWELKKVTTSNKKCLTVYPNKKKLTVKVKGKKKSSRVTVKLYLEIKKKPWEKYKKCKYFKKRNKVLKCTVKIVSPSVQKIVPDMSKVSYQDAEVEWDGKAHSIYVETSTLPVGVFVDHYEGNGQTDAGTYNVTAYFAVTDTKKYHVPEPMTRKLTINKATPDMSKVSYQDAEVKWDGKAHSIYIDTSTLPEGVFVDHYEGNGQTDVGTYNVTAYFAVTDTKNYHVPEPITRTLKILKPDVPSIDNPGTDNPGTNDPKEDIDVSGIKYKNLTAVYDKTAKYVGYDESTLPKGISSISFEGDGKIDAGTYDVTVNFTVSDSSKYNVPEPIKKQLTISKAKINATLDEKSFKDNHQISLGGVDSSVAVSYEVNGEKCEGNPNITTPGTYTVVADFDVDTKNYDKPEPLQAVYHVKRNNVWYELSMEPTIENGKVKVEIYLKNVKVPRAEDYTIFVLGFDLNYDRSVLEYDSNNGFIQEDGWDGKYNPNRNNDETVEGRDAIVTYENYDQGIMPDQEKVCTIVYNIKQGKTLENSQLMLNNPTVSAETDEDLPFSYTTNSQKIALQPAENIPEYTVYMKWDCINDAKYEYEDVYPEDKDAYIEALRQYLNKN